MVNSGGAAGWASGFALTVTRTRHVFSTPTRMIVSRPAFNKQDSKLQLLYLDRDSFRVSWWSTIACSDAV